MSTNVETGVSVFFESISEAARYHFGRNVVDASIRMGKLCKKGEIFNGHTFKIINDYNDHPTRFDWRRKPILQIDKDGDEIIRYFRSVSEAARFGYDNFVHKCCDVSSVRKNISRCINGRDRVVYGFMWRYVRHDEPPENVPLPEPNYEGL